MREIKTKGITIKVIGSTKIVEQSSNLIEDLAITGKEKEDRLIIMNAITKLKIKAIILYEGNTVYNNGTILKNLRAIKRHGLYYMNDYTYKWLINATGSIAHYNKSGWINKYPTVKDLRDYFHCNEWSKSIYDYVPEYNSSNKFLALEVLKIFK